MNVLVIGGTGHFGQFLTRMLVKDGQHVTVLSSGHTPLADEPEFQRAELVKLSYSIMLKDQSFLRLLKDKSISCVVDVIQDNLPGVYAAARQAGVSQIVACGSVWMLGRPKVVPTPEQPQTPCPFEGYQRRFDEMREVLAQSRKGSLSVSAIFPPNICGPGKIPLDGMGGRDLDVHRAHQAGQPVVLPFPGTNLVGPCDAEDVARGFCCAIRNPAAAAGEFFNVGAAYALTAEQFIRTYADIYGTTIPIQYASPETYMREICPDVGANFHFLEHMCPDITKITTRLGFRPVFTPEQTMARAVEWMYRTNLLPRKK